jgi:hypothetical protein
MEIRLKESKIDFPKLMLERMVDYLKEAPNKKLDDFDCLRFVHYIITPADKIIAGCAREVFVDSLLSRRIQMEEMTPALEQTLRPGKVVAMGRAEYEPVMIQGKDYLRASVFYEHWAIYLGNGLYLSQLGNNGLIGVGDLQNLEKAYQAKQTWVLDLK